MKIPNKCPSCDGELRIKKLECLGCKTVIEGNFKLSRFNRLDEDDLNFVETFLSTRGSIKEMEKKMNLSYPTVRARLEKVVDKLGLKPAPDIFTEDRLNILEKLEKGEITPAQAAKLIKEGGN